LIKGLSHITGGGIVGNTKRILPPGTSLDINWNSWEWPTIFKIIKDTGEVETEEMRHVFNLGIGMIIVCEESKAISFLMKLKFPVQELSEELPNQQINKKRK